MPDTSHDGPLPQSAARIMLRPIASSLPLGFFAFTMGTVLLTALELQWVLAAEDRQLMVMVLAFVLPLEALSGLFAFLARDSGAATGLLTLSAAWAATAITVLGGAPGSRSLALAIFLLTLTPVMLVISGASVPVKPLFGLLLLSGAARFALTGVYQTPGSRPSSTPPGGWACRSERSRCTVDWRCWWRKVTSVRSCRSVGAGRREPRWKATSRPRSIRSSRNPAYAVNCEANPHG